MINRLEEYNQRISAISTKRELISKKQKHLPLLRFGLFLLFAFLLYKYLTIVAAWPEVLAILSLSALTILGFIDSNLKRRIKQYDILIEINRKEVIALGGDYSSFDPGNEFIDQSHDYTYDLDIFGTGSLFQFINRTATIFGKRKLADYLSNAFNYKDQIVERQQAVHELSGMTDMRQNLLLLFHNEQISATDSLEISLWLRSDSPVKNIKLLRILASGLPSITWLFILLSIINIVSFPVILIVLQFIIVFLYGKQTIKVQNIITSKSKILKRYALCLQMIENTDFESHYLLDLKKKLAPDFESSPSKAIHQLSAILKYMDSNLNLLVSVILNGLFMFNLHLLLKVEKWKKENRLKAPLWFETIATFDAMSSLANFTFNHPHYIFPTVVEDDFSFVAQNLGHPLIAEDQCVANDVEIKSWNQFYVITGANMSGKSTFLRTIGVNYVLAMAGAPVCSTKLSFYPVQIHSSIRTSDSLVKHESYFYAELKRLKQIIEELESGKQKLILLDEILKGTNSKDKQAGSIALIEQLLNYKSVGLFATHDLMLGQLADQYPGHVHNLCFEIEISGDKMMIDYKLHNGVCKNLNATYLMRNMGILFENNKSERKL